MICSEQRRDDVTHDHDRCDETGDQLRWNDSRHYWKPRLEHGPVFLCPGLQELYATLHCNTFSLSLSLSLSLSQSVCLSVCLRFLLKLVYYSLQSLHHVPVVPQFFRLEHTANNLRAFQNCTSSSLKPDQKAKESLTLNKIWISFFSSRYLIGINDMFSSVF